MYYNYPLARDKIEIKKETLLNYLIKIAEIYNIPIVNVNKLVPNFFDKEKYVFYDEKLDIYIGLGLKIKETYHAY